MGATGFDPDDFPFLGTERRPATATEAAKAQEAAARRGYAAGSRDGAREMRLKAARLVEAAGCLCVKPLATGRAPESHPMGCGSIIEIHEAHCPAALGEA